MVERYLTGHGDAGQRLDQFLARQQDGLSRTKIRSIIDIGGVHVDGRRVRTAGRSMSAGQRVEVYRDRGPLDPFRLEPCHILFEDRYIIVIDKPSGIETQPTPARYKGTLYEALQIWLKRDSRFGRRLEIGMSQRLDRETSGVIVFSIHPRAHRSISAQMQSRTTRKSYLAVVEGMPQPPAGVYHSYLLRDRRSGRMRSVPPEVGGKEAITRYRVVKTVTEPEHISLVELDLVTGRSHQIRAHLSEAGHPLLGDRRYGGRGSFGEMRLERHLLHARLLELHHPVSGELLSFRAALPADISVFEAVDRGGDPAAPADKA